MAMLIDIVNEKDEVIATATRAEAHQKSLGHRIAVIFVLDPDGRVIVQQRKKEKDGLLDVSAGGHMEAGESYDVAAQRELGEELGVTVPVKFLGKHLVYDWIPDGSGRVAHWFASYEVQLTQEELSAIKLSEQEVAKMIPMTVVEIADSIRKDPTKWTGGMTAMINFYIEAKGLSIPPVPVR